MTTRKPSRSTSATATIYSGDQRRLFHARGKKDPKAGIRLAKELRSRDPYLPMIIESSENENAHDVIELGGTFIDKNSKNFP